MSQGCGDTTLGERLFMRQRLCHHNRFVNFVVGYNELDLIILNPQSSKHMFQAISILYIICLSFICCGNNSASQIISDNSLTEDTGVTVQARFPTPAGFERKSVDKNSFAYYLRNLPLKPAGTKVKYFNGNIKNNLVYDAVVDMDIGKKDLQQCADAIMRLRAEYFYSRKEFDKISFHFTNGFKVDYSEWIKGNRIVVNGNQTFWRKSTNPSNSYKDFRNYMDLVFIYAGTLSLEKSLQTKNIKDLSIGDVFIIGGSPGHAVIVVDLAENKAGEKVFLLAQSYMPAQEIQILKNFNDSKISPWYSSNRIGNLETPEWTFDLDQLKTW